MQIRIDENSKRLAKLVGVNVETLASYLARDIKPIVDDTEENFGCRLRDCLNEETPVLDVANLIDYKGVTVNCEMFEALLNVVIIGDFDCPICGGKMEITDGEEKCVGGDGYNAPYEYETIWSEYTCTNCGYIERN